MTGSQEKGMTDRTFLFGWCERGDHDKCPGDSTLPEEGKGTSGPPDFEAYICSCPHHTEVPPEKVIA